MNTKSAAPVFTSAPRALSDVVRNIVVARATAGAYDTRETGPQAVLACRAAARQKLGCQRLNSEQAEEVDALVMTTRAQAFEHMNPAMRGVMPADAVHALAQETASADPAASPDADTLKAILAVVTRIETLIKMIVALVMDRALAARQSGAEPQLIAADADPNDALPDTWRGAAQNRLPAFQGTPASAALAMPHADARDVIVTHTPYASPVSSTRALVESRAPLALPPAHRPARRETCVMPSGTSNGIVLYGKN